MHLYAAFVISGAIASLAGVLYVYYNRFINPVAASFQISVEVSLMAIVGGSGTIVGPFIGAGIFLGLRNWVSSFFELHAAVMGARVHRHRAVGAERHRGLRRALARRRRQAERAGHDAPPSRSTDLAKVFGGLRAVDGVSLQVAPGERRALIGPNGAGKTTLFHCVTGTLQPSSGQVQLFGHDVTHLPEHRRTKLGMGRTFQITNVFTDLSLAENLALAIVGTDRRKWIWNRPLTRVSCDSRAGARRARGGRPEGSRRRSGEAPLLRRAPPARAGARAQHPSQGAVPRRALRRAVAERAAAHLQHGPCAAARHHRGADRARHGRGARPGRPRHRDEPRAGDGGGHARRGAGQPEVRDVYFGHV